MKTSPRAWLACLRCGQRFDLQPLLFGCPSCAEHGVTAALEVCYAVAAAEVAALLATGRAGGSPPGQNGAGRSIWDWAVLLPPCAPHEVVSLGEGWTPLLPAKHVAAAAGLPQVLVKVEASSPTDSFKDRLNAVNVTQARHFGYRCMLATSTGNHGVSLAAYAAAAGLHCLIACEAGAAPLAVQQMRLHGARVVLPAPPTADVDPADALRTFCEPLVRRERWWPSVGNDPQPYANPFGMEGYKTIAFEVWAQLGLRPPDRCFVPTGGGDSLAGVASCEGIPRAGAGRRCGSEPGSRCLSAGSGRLAGPRLSPPAGPVRTRRHRADPRHLPHHQAERQPRAPRAHFPRRSTARYPWRHRARRRAAR